MILNQVFNAINLGIVIVDRDYRVKKWNRWMEIHSGIKEEQIMDRPLFEIFPGLNTPKFNRNFKAVFSFGNFSFFSQKLHGYLFPFKSTGYLESEFEFMQQSCAMGPIRDENNEIKYAFIYVQDVTEVAIYEKKLMEQSLRDGLTGVYNRKHLEQELDEECTRHRRYSRNLSIIMIDIDNFKRVNDEYGHQCGDFILRSVALRISSNIRNIDTFFRYGGEEFCCLLPETDINGALVAAERFRKAIEEMENNYYGHIIKVTISLGVAGLDSSMNGPQDLVKSADEALYRAKSEGRNRVASNKPAEGVTTGSSL